MATKKAVTGGDLLAALIATRDALMLAELELMEALVSREVLVSTATLKDQVFLDSLHDAIGRMATYREAIRADIHGQALTAKLDEIVEEFMQDELPGLNAAAAARAFENMAPASVAVQ